MTVIPLRRTSASQFSGRPLAELLGEPVSGVYDDDSWDISGHRDTASSVRRRLHFGGIPAHLRDALKELFILATRPFLHTKVTTELTGRKPKDLKTVERWLAGLTVDLAWLHQRAGSLAAVTQEDYDAWKDESGLGPNYRRISALKSFALYARAMSPGVDRLTHEPWPGVSALSLGGGAAAVRRRVNSTAPLSVADVLGPWLTLGMFLVEHGHAILDRHEAMQRNRAAQPLLVVDAQGREVVWLDRDGFESQGSELLGQVAGACLFVTAAFTGMRATELDAVPRHSPLEAIEVTGTTRWLLRSYLVKGLERPREERWLVPPIVADAVGVLIRLLDVKDVPPDRLFAATGQAPLFDRRAVHGQRDGARVTARLERAIDQVARAGQDLVRRGIVPPLPVKDDPATAALLASDRPDRAAWLAVLVKPDGRELRRTFARIVSARPHGPQAAMEQFKWQHPETAAGYFRVAPDAVALGQRELYEDVAELYENVVVDAMVDEFHVWERAVEAGVGPRLPAGPDGRRKRDVFAAVHEVLSREPRVEEDDRRLRVLLRQHARGIRLTEFGWCDFDPDLALCGAEEGTPLESFCQPNRCLNHTTVSATLAAHQVKHDRLLSLTRDRSMPKLAREQAGENAALIERDLGDLIEVQGR
ncbi:hypothetical protein GCU60_05665 [Blastococcus saxobsidens]|uniref:Uncharacterized protein n=1 Tax=Blastococcus saxobsidens TaxID=138336 RepID=A0A6L9W1A6_9ACTN|nr:hypothetical protein [Blastococcus saxobsidens]NEK85251.1 hypothetical protein [Blastococcus saxobsidens]